MKIILGYDEFGVPLANTIRDYLIEKGYEVVVIGPEPQNPLDYPDVAEQVALEIQKGNYPRGVLVCGTGCGMAIVANKIPGVRAACCHDAFSAERARKSNDAQIITFGNLVIGEALAKNLLDIWLSCEFEGGRSTRKIAKIKEIDNRYRRSAGKFQTVSDEKCLKSLS